MLYHFPLKTRIVTHGDDQRPLTHSWLISYQPQFAREKQGRAYKGKVSLDDGDFLS